MSPTTPESVSRPAPSPSASSVPPRHSNQTMFFAGLVIFIIVVVAGIVGVGAYKMYGANDTDRFTMAVAKVLPLPVAKVAGESISYYDYAFDYRSLSQYVAYQLAHEEESTLPPTPPTQEEISQQVLARLIANVFIKRVAKEQGITVGEEDTQVLKTQLLSRFPNEEAAEQDIKNQFGISLKEYEARVMYPYALQSKLDQKLLSDAALKDAAKKQAQDLLDQIKGGASFEDLAIKYSEDGSSKQWGELPWFKKGEMVLPFEEVAFKLKKGELAPELVETEYGYHIIRVEDRRVEKVKDDAGKTVDEEQVKARHILIRFPSLDSYLARLLRSNPVKVYGNLPNPFKDI